MSTPEQESTPPFESRYPELSIPEHGFVSTIPPHLLEGVDEQTRWLLSEISRNTQATEFACRGVVDLSRHLRTLNGKTYKNESGLGQLTEKVKEIDEQAKLIIPLSQPVAQFINLWGYRGFRWAFYAATFFFFTYLLPYYLAHPFSLETLFNRVLGG